MKCLAVLVFLCASTSFAKNLPPIPPAVLQARTIYVVNHSGQQRITDEAYASFNKWQRFTVVSEKDADLTVVFTSSHGESPELEMQVFTRNETEAAFVASSEWSGREHHGLLAPSVASVCVGKFRKWVER